MKIIAFIVGWLLGVGSLVAIAEALNLQTPVPFFMGMAFGLIYTMLVLPWALDY